MFETCLKWLLEAKNSFFKLESYIMFNETFTMYPTSFGLQRLEFIHYS